jgi:hypothetical protein
MVRNGDEIEPCVFGELGVAHEINRAVLFRHQLVAKPEHGPSFPQAKSGRTPGRRPVTAVETLRAAEGSLRPMPVFQTVAADAFARRR